MQASSSSTGDSRFSPINLRASVADRVRPRILDILRQVVAGCTGRSLQDAPVDGGAPRTGWPSRILAPPRRGGVGDRAPLVGPGLAPQAAAAVIRYGFTIRAFTGSRPGCCPGTTR